MPHQSALSRKAYPNKLKYRYRNRYRTRKAIGIIQKLTTAKH